MNADKNLPGKPGRALYDHLGQGQFYLGSGAPVFAKQFKFQINKLSKKIRTVHWSSHQLAPGDLLAPEAAGELHGVTVRPRQG